MSLTKLIGVACGIIVTAGLLIGYLVVRKHHAEQNLITMRDPAATAQTAAPAQAQIYEDEAVLKGSQALIGGTVLNISQDKLQNLTVTIALKRRSDNSTQLREVEVDPKDLLPGQQGRYTLALSSHDWSSVRLVRLWSGVRNAEVAYKSAVGKPRPPEPSPQTQIKVVTSPRPKSKGDEFINTPDTPVVVH